MTALSKLYKGADPKMFAEHDIGTVHIFQGKEAGVGILCLAASVVRKKGGRVLEEINADAFLR